MIASGAPLRRRCMLAVLIGAALIHTSAFAQVSDQVEQIVGKGDFHQRLNAVHQLPDRLSQAQIQQLQNFLTQPSGELGEAALKNDLLNMLRAQSRAPQGLTETLLTIYRDSRHTALMRDYAIQHLGAWQLQSPPSSSIRQTLWQACDQTGNSIAGTALLALYRLRNHLSSAERQRLGQQALAIAGKGASPLSRLTALRICGELELREAGEISRSVLRARSDISLKLSAIATLGDVGVESDLALLESFLAHPRLARAAELAIGRLLKKNGEV